MNSITLIISSVQMSELLQNELFNCRFFVINLQSDDYISESKNKRAVMSSKIV